MEEPFSTTLSQPQAFPNDSLVTEAELENIAMEEEIELMVDAADDMDDTAETQEDMDVLDGATYKSLKNTHFNNELDIAMSIMNDGFVVEKRRDRLFTIVHLLLFNYSLTRRYKETYMHELCIFPGKKKPKSFDSFISVVLTELQWLSTYGLVVETNVAGQIRLKVHPLICGAILQVATLVNEAISQ